METSRAREFRKTVTVLFCDVVHSTGLAEDVDPEALRRVMWRFFDEMRIVLERHGGTLEKFSGDEVMAVFGVPVVHADDALRAVRAAAEMRERLESLNSELDLERDLQLQIRIGINTGEVMAGDPATAQTFVTGSPIVLAKRLQEAAEPGEILIGKATYPLIRDAIKAGPLERFPAKGRREPAERRRVDDVDHEAPGIARRLDLHMVGREREFELLLRAFDSAVRERSCRLVTVLGLAGIGKSRLAAELVRDLTGRAAIVEGRCLPYGEGITYWPLTEIVRGLGGEQGLRDALFDTEDPDHVIGPILSAIGVSAAGAPSEETFWAVRRVFETLGRRRPLVVLLEDLHWAEPTFLDLVEYVSGWSRDAPVLVVCIARLELLEARPTWMTTGVHADVLSLEPLSSAETHEMLEHLGPATLDDDDRRRIVEAAEGNPLFVEHIAALVDERDESGRLPIPSSIHALLAERLDRLPDVEREILERAAVIGKEFTLRAITELMPPADRDPAPNRLLALVRKQLIRPGPSVPGPEDRFRFQHVLIRDVAYEGMPKQFRAELNERYADWLETDAAAPELDELVGYHLEQAYSLRSELGPRDPALRRLAERAVDRLASAGRRALGRGDARAAATLLRRAADLPIETHSLRSEILLELGAALRESGDLDASETILSEVAESARTAGDRRADARAAIEAAFTRLYRWEALEELLAVADRTLPVLEEEKDDAGVAKALALVGFMEYVKCRVGRGEELLERALEHAQRAGDRRQSTWALGLLAKTNLDGPRPVEEAVGRVDELAARLPVDRALEARLATNRAPLEAMRGRAEEARELYSQAQETLRELGQSLSLANSRLDSGRVELLAGDPEAAERELRAGFETLEAIGGTSVLASVAALLGQAVLAQGRVEEGEFLAATSARVSSDEDVFSQVEWRTLRALVCARSGRAGEAEDVARSAVRLMAGTDALNLHAEARAALGEALQAAGRSDDAEEAFAEANRLSAEKGNASWATRGSSTQRRSVRSRSSKARSGRGDLAGGT